MVYKTIFEEFFLNYYFLSFIISWILSVLIKSFLSSRKGFSIKNGFKNGGMPSSHSAVVSSITAAIFLNEGFSSLFFVSFVFSLIVISDAFILRRNVGIQGEKINVLLKNSKLEEIKVVYGHTFVQVLCGIALGIFVSVIIKILFF